MDTFCYVGKGKFCYMNRKENFGNTGRKGKLWVERDKFSDQNLLTVKRYNLERYGRRSFSVAGPSLWNALPSDIRNSVSLPAFRSSLKTHLFREAFVTLM